MTGRRSHGRLSALNGVVHQGNVAAAFRGGRAPRGRGPRVGQLPQARHTFVDGMVDLEVLSVQVSRRCPR